MTRGTKIVLSDKELAAARDANWILTKRRVIDAAIDILGSCVNLADEIILAHPGFPAEAALRQPKISRGENYLELPYAILDHPRYFSGDSILAVRTMFWWSHFFSVTLQVSGSFLPSIIRGLTHENHPPVPTVFFCINPDPWQHHFGEDNYIPIHDWSVEKRLIQVNDAGFVKLAVKYDLEDWNRMPEKLNEGYKAIARFFD